ncbi:MAG TPA: hypothetical protein VFP96_07215 [Candidatus Acidoferrum sp.]|nr:hypothetical protein [Candidatus Acidoferrum sp.]
MQFHISKRLLLSLVAAAGLFVIVGFAQKTDKPAKVDSSPGVQLPMAPEWSESRAFISSSAKKAQSKTSPSRSNSSIPAFTLSTSPLADEYHRLQTVTRDNIAVRVLGGKRKVMASAISMLIFEPEGKHILSA